MLTIAFVLSAISLLAIASPTPLEQRGIRIPLSKRISSNSSDVPVDLDLLNAARAALMSKYELRCELYKNNTGDDCPVSLLGDGADANNTSGDIRKRALATVALTASGNVWQGPITIGSSAQALNVLFDTGSADLLVPGTACTTGACVGHTQYDPTMSTTAMNGNKKFTFALGTSNTDTGLAQQYTDNVGIAGDTATGQTLAVATTYPSSLSKAVFPPDGVLGMAYQSMSTSNTPTVLQTLCSNSQIPACLFGFKLSKTGTSELSLGALDPTLYTGPLTYVPVTKQGFWQVQLGGVSVNGQVVRGVGAVQSVIDTGTSYIMMSQRQAGIVYKSIPGAKDASQTVGSGYFTYPCASKPAVSLTFGGESFAIDPTLFSIGQVGGNPTQCIGAIMGGNTDSWIIGDTFLQNVYTAFDMDNNRVGFAKLA